MKKLKVFNFLLVAFISSFFLVSKVNALFTKTTAPKNNTFTIKNTGDYVVYHKYMDVTGQIYVEDENKREEGEEPFGTVITPDVYPETGFITPAVQEVTIEGFELIEINYLYERLQYNLVVQNSENLSPTSTTSGTYYYGTPIHLVANPQDQNGRDFAKWSDGTTNPDYSFTMTEDVTIKPIYGEPFEITFEANGGSPSPAPILRYEGETLGELPVVTKDDCELSEGSYSERNCTYAYKFLGWYTEPTFENQVNENYQPTGNMTLYAKWTKVYFHNDQTVFTGTNFLDTEIALFSRENADKDFIATFTIDDIVGSGDADQLLFTDMHEGHSPYAGVTFKYTHASNKYEITANAAAGTGFGKRQKLILTGGISEGDTIIYKRESGLFYYSLDGGETFTLFNDFSNFSLFFDVNATFGAGYNERNQVYRYFRGTLSNMTLELIEPKSYTVTFDANGGTGVMIDESFTLIESKALTLNSFEYEGKTFSHWTTNADGTGNSYTDGQVVSGLGGENDVITLYAQWNEPAHYFVEFRANGGVGETYQQEFVVDESQNLEPSRFTKDGYIFDSWNTKADGTGTRYEEGELVNNLGHDENEVVVLYAHYGKREYHYNGEITFDGIDDYIDTEVNIYSAVNIDKDFTISFDVIYVDPANADADQATILSGKDENNIISGNHVPGFAVRFNGSASPINITARWGDHDASGTVSSNNVPIHFEFTRVNGVVTCTYSYNGTDHVIDLYDQADWTLTANNNTNVTFGAIIKDNAPDRFFTGTLANIDVVVYDS